MKVLLRKYNLEEDADKLGTCVQDIIDIAYITQDTVEYFKLKGTVAQYMVAAQEALQTARQRGKNHCVKYDRNMPIPSEGEKAVEHL